MTPRPTFDSYAESYDDHLNRALAVTGSDKEYYARTRIAWLAKILAQSGAQPDTGMDYGCGNGSATPLLLDILKLRTVTGVDVSPQIVAEAGKRYSSQALEFRLIEDSGPLAARFDLVYCNGVFHHVDESERPKAMKYVWDSLRPGGWFSFWENNPWNPATHYVMSRCAFDKEARMLSPLKARKLLTDSGFQIVRTDFLFIFPESLKLFRFIEGVVNRLPLGAQYQILAMKPVNPARP